MRKKFLGILLAAGVIAAMTGCGSTNNVDGEKATADENGNYLINGSFEEADFTGWTVNNVNDSTEELDIYDRDTDCFLRGYSPAFFIPVAVMWIFPQNRR